MNKWLSKNLNAVNFIVWNISFLIMGGKSKYVKDWEKDPAFKDWIERSKKGDEHYHCKWCNWDGNANRTNVLSHSTKGSHIEAKNNYVAQP